MFITTDYLPMEELDLFFSQSLNRPSACSFRDYETHYCRHDSFSKALTYSSVLPAHRYPDYQDWVNTFSLSDALIPLTKIQFRLDAKRPPYWVGTISNSTKNQMAMTRQCTLDSLYSHKDMGEISGRTKYVCHPSLGSGHAFDYMGPELFYSACVNYFARLFRTSEQLAKHAGDKSCNDPGLIAHLYEKQQNRCLNIQQATQIQMHKLEVISCVKRLRQKFLYLHETHEYQTLLDDSRSLLHRYKGKDRGNVYFYILESDSIHLYCPTEYKNLLMDEYVCWLTKRPNYSEGCR